MDFKDIQQFTRSGDWECTYRLDGFVNQIREFVDQGLELNPDFQRGHVWTEQQQIAFVEYVLRGGKSGLVVYLNDPNWTSTSTKPSDTGFTCVDGLQRITAVTKFVDDEIPAFGYLCSEFTGKMHVCTQTMRINVNNLPTRADVLRWYLEMNSGGTPHTESELERVRGLLELAKAGGVE